jgi:SAM-dependent methyltransferase
MSRTKNDKLTKLYKKLHEEDNNYGSSSIDYLPEISLLIEYLKPKTVLDYGCGKGSLVKILSKKFPLVEFYGYDPSVDGYEEIPVRKADLVINTDVLEHIPSEILPNVLDEIASISSHAIFMLHHALAYATLPDGQNAHCTVRPSFWYQMQITQAFGEEMCVFQGRQPWLSTIVTFPVHPHIYQQYMKIIAPE